MTNDLAQVVRNYYLAFDARRDVDEVCAVFTDDVEYLRPEGVLRGRAAVREHFATTRKVIGVRHHLVRVLVLDRTVVVEGRLTGALGGMALDLPFAEVWDFDEEEHATRRASYFDRRALP